MKIQLMLDCSYKLYPNDNYQKLKDIIQYQRQCREHDC